MERGNQFALNVKEEDSNQVDMANEEQPVFLNGTLVVDGPPSDPQFNVTTRNEACIYRKVQVYCWVEHLTNFEERRGDQVRRGTKCDYKPTWCDASNVPDSRRFRDKAKVNIRSEIPSQ